MENSLLTHPFTTEEVMALYYFLRKEPLNHHILGLTEAVTHICEIAKHELATRDNKAT